MNGAKRPYVICHMVPSVDGRIVTKNWKLPANVLGEYERTAQTFDAEAWMIGRISMAPYAGKARVPARKVPQPIPRTDFIARRDAESYAIALDPSGKLTWKSNSIDEEHVITVLTEAVSDDYLAFLQSKGVSYLFGGKTDLNLKSVLEKLRKEFGIKKLLLEGGGKINGSFLAADSHRRAERAGGAHRGRCHRHPVALRCERGKGLARPLKLVSFEKRTGDLLWLRYKVKR